MASGNGKRTVVQLRQQLHELGLSTHANKNMLLERSRLYNPDTEVPEQTTEAYKPKRQRINEESGNDC